MKETPSTVKQIVAAMKALDAYVKYLMNVGGGGLSRHHARSQ